jgi:hypothetical protein
MQIDKAGWRGLQLPDWELECLIGGSAMDMTWGVARDRKMK